MDTSAHNLVSLFAQLGLPNQADEIADFIDKHRGIASDIALADANIWSQSQADFISQAINEDADWSEVVDTLDSLLR